MERKALGEPLTSEQMFASRDVSHAALNHWFVRNRGVQRHGWEVNYEPKYYFENLQCPAGISDVYWDTLAAAERRWSAPVTKQLEVGDTRKFSERVATKTGSFNKISMPTNGPVIDPGANSEPALLRLLSPVKKEEKAAENASESTGKVLPFPNNAFRWKDAGNW
jgi:hypothetical protein